MSLQQFLSGLLLLAVATAAAWAVIDNAPSTPPIEPARNERGDDPVREQRNAQLERRMDEVAPTRTEPAPPAPAEEELPNDLPPFPSDLNRQPFGHAAPPEPTRPLRAAPVTIADVRQQCGANNLCAIRMLESTTRTESTVAYLIDVYRQTGNSSRARTLARMYVARYPNGPRAATLRSFLDQR